MTDPVRSSSDADARFTSHVPEGARRDEWWRGMPITAFADEVNQMTTKEHEALAAELASVSAIVNATVTDTTKDTEQRGRARYMLASISEKRKLLSSKLIVARATSRESKKNEAEDLLEQAEARAENEPAAAIHSIIKTMRLMWGLDGLRDDEDDDERGSNE